MLMKLVLTRKELIPDWSVKMSYKREMILVCLSHIYQKKNQLVYSATLYLHFKHKFVNCDTLYVLLLHSVCSLVHNG